MDKPTEAQIKELWERCGFVNEITRSPSLSGFGGDDVYNWTRPDKVIHSKKLPTIDLNNLFKYAVPKLQDLRWVKFYFDGECELRIGNRGITGVDDDPALALFWAIYEVIK